MPERLFCRFNVCETKNHNFISLRDRGMAISQVLKQNTYKYVNRNPMCHRIRYFLTIFGSIHA